MPILKKIFEIYVIFSAFFIYIFCKLYLFFTFYAIKNA